MLVIEVLLALLGFGGHLFVVDHDFLALYGGLDN